MAMSLVGQQDPKVGQHFDLSIGADLARGDHQGGPSHPPPTRGARRTTRRRTYAHPRGQFGSPGDGYVG